MKFSMDALKKILVKINYYSFLVICLQICISCESSQQEPDNNNQISIDWEISSYEFIDSCASDFAVDYAICRKNDNIIVGYYDKKHQLTLAKRDPQGCWTYTKINEFVNFDSHKYITIVIDNDGIIHLCANMHSEPLIYYKGQDPYSIDNLTKHQMIGVDEGYCTYPQFMYESQKLLFHYRNGYSGNGIEIFNEYNYITKSWERKLDRPLFDGLGQSNAYFEGPIIGPDNLYHIIWCWRDSPDCVTNHGLYYASSPDLIHWFDISGNTKEIPINPSDKQFIVDDIPVEAGLLNNVFCLGFDDLSNPLIEYQKFDDNDKTNIFIAHTGKQSSKIWTIEQLTNWDWKWNFSGLGAIIVELNLLKIWGIGNMVYCTYKKLDSPSQMISFNMSTSAIQTYEYHEYPENLDIRTLENSELAHIIYDNYLPYEKSRYILRYETLNYNRDQESEKEINPSPLYLYKLKKY